MRQLLSVPMTPFRSSNQSKKRSGRKGAVLLEGSFVMLSAMAILMFTMEMGRLLFFQQYYNDRARAAARLAVVNDWTQAMTANYVCYNSTTAPAGGSATPGFLGVLPSHVTLSILGSAATHDARYRVRVAGIPMLVLLPWIRGTYTAPAAVATIPVESMGASD
jgi:hypothetical protein